MSTSSSIPAENTASAAQTVRDVVCTHCGCLCDDIDLTLTGGRIVEARHACTRGEAWFVNQPLPARPVATVDGQPVELAAAVEAAARLLRSARYPLLYGLAETTCEAQRVAVAIADWISGNIDTTTSTAMGPAGITFQGVGEVTCTLGEIRNRGDLLIYWGTNPAESQPRHLSRYSLLPEGMFVPRGRADRTCVVVDVKRTATAEMADVFLQIKPGCDFEALWVLRALAKGVALDAATVERDTGVPLVAWQDLLARLQRARFGVLLFGRGLMTSPGKHLNGEAVLALTRDMNAHTRFVCRPLRGGGNVTGADSVITWTTGYPFGVNLSRGYPRYNAGEYTADAMLARREVDAAMIIAGDPTSDFSPAALAHLASIPSIWLGANDAPESLGAKITFATSTYGIDTPGTVYRMDDVPLPLRPTLARSRPSDVEVLTQIEQRVRADQ